MGIRNLFYWSYWFEQPYIAHGKTLAAWLAIFLVLILVGLVAMFVRRLRTDSAEKRLLARIGSCGFSMGFVGLVWLFFRQERVAFLAWRFWLLIWLAVFIPWVTRIVLYAVRRLPQIRAEHAERALKEKYLPKK